MLRNTRIGSPLSPGTERLLERATYVKGRG